MFDEISENESVVSGFAHPQSAIKRDTKEAPLLLAAALMMGYAEVCLSRKEAVTLQIKNLDMLDMSSFLFSYAYQSQWGKKI